MIVLPSAWITDAFSHTFFTGFCCTTIGALVTCAPAGPAMIAASATSRPAAATARAAVIANFLKFFIKRYFQRLQEFDVLRRDLNLRRRFLFQNFLVHADVQRLEEPAVLRGHLGFF